MTLSALNSKVINYFNLLKKISFIHKIKTNMNQCVRIIPEQNWCVNNLYTLIVYLYIFLVDKGTKRKARGLYRQVKMFW